MQETNKTRLGIKDWAEDDRPREKLINKGVSTLSDAELLAILIGSGSRNETVVDLSQRILHSVNNNLNTLGKLTVKDLIKNFHGIGEAKAVTIIASLELGRRRKLATMDIEPQIKSSADVYTIMHPVLADLPHEEVWVLLLNKSNRIIKKHQASKGGISGTVIDIRIIMKEAIESLASGMILCHNHPSGNHQPSIEDDMQTTQLKEAGKIMDIRLLDHVIVCDHSYYSYGDEGRL